MGLRVDATRNWKAVLFLSIIVPMGFATAFRISGMLQEPSQISNIVECKTVDYSIPRPSGFPEINEITSSDYDSIGFKASFSLLIGEYTEDSVAYGCDLFGMKASVIASATASGSYIERVRVCSSRDEAYSVVDWLETLLEFTNLSQVGRSDGWTRNGDYLEAYVAMSGMNHSQIVEFSASIHWGLLDSDSETHRITFTCEVTYFNGTAYNMVSQPIRLTVTERS